MDFLQTICLNDNDNILETNSVKSTGFGLAWYNFVIQKWKYIKSSKYYKDVSNINEIVHYASTSPLVVGVLNTNTQPITYNKQMFMYCGCLGSFAMLRRTLMKQLSLTYRECVKSETESEWLFYFMLSLMEYLETKKWGKLIHEMDMQLQTIKMCVQQLKMHFKQFYINTIYVNSSYSAITNYAYGTNGQSLYLNGEDTGKLLITSEPIGTNFTLIPRNTIIFVNHQTNQYNIANIDS
jgi:hypothetical protein